jgi:hypothetical protein
MEAPIMTRPNILHGVAQKMCDLAEEIQQPSATLVDQARRGIMVSKDILAIHLVPLQT